MRKVGSAPALELLDGGLDGPEEESHGDFDRALTEVRAVSAGLDVCYGKGEIAQTELPPAPEPPAPPGIVEQVAAPGLPPIETEVESYLIGLDLPPPRAQRHRAASLLEQGQSVGETPEASQAELKA